MVVPAAAVAASLWSQERGEKQPPLPFSGLNIPWRLSLSLSLWMEKNPSLLWKRDSRDEKEAEDIDSSPVSMEGMIYLGRKLCQHAKANTG